MGGVRCVAAYVRVLSAENVGAGDGIRWLMTTAADYGGRACVRVRVRKRVCILLIGGWLRARTYVCVRPCVCVCACVRSLMRARVCVSARARGHDDFGKHDGLCRPMAARLLAGRATAIRDDEERGSETGRRERMTGRDDGSRGERTGFATSNNECLLLPAKPSFSLLQPADEAPRASPSDSPLTIASRFARFPETQRDAKTGGGLTRYK